VSVSRHVAGEPLSSLLKGDKGVHLVLAKVSGQSVRIIYGVTLHHGDTLHALGGKAEAASKKK
jgi:hypothetical protein